jgi:hypothetical protein
VTNEGSQELQVFDRRNLLRKGMLAGFGAVVIGVSAPAFTRGAPAAAATRVRGSRPATGNLALSPAIDGMAQPDWSFCNKWQAGQPVPYGVQVGRSQVGEPDRQQQRRSDAVGAFTGRSRSRVG